MNILTELKLVKLTKTGERARIIKAKSETVLIRLVNSFGLGIGEIFEVKFDEVEEWPRAIQKPHVPPKKGERWQQRKVSQGMTQR